MPETALFGSGRPVLVVPYIQKAGMKLDRTLICWDGSRAAARAIGDAMPFLVRTKSIDVLSVMKSETALNELPGADIARHLARHNLKVDFKRIVANEDIGNTILSAAADLDFGHDSHGRLWPLAAARICPRRGHAVYPEYNDCSGPDVALRPRRIVDDTAPWLWNGDVLAAHTNLLAISDIARVSINVRLLGQGRHARDACLIHVIVEPSLLLKNITKERATMPTETLILVVVISAIFAVFAGALAWADFYTRGLRKS